MKRRLFTVRKENMLDDVRWKAKSTLLAVAATIGLLAVAAPAHAVTIKGSDTGLMYHINKPKKDIDVTSDGSRKSSLDPAFIRRLRVIDGGRQVAYVQAGSTGQGDTQEQCDRRANFINALFKLAGEKLDEGDLESAATAAIIADQQVHDAQSAGCFIIWKAGLPPEPEPEIG